MGGIVDTTYEYQRRWSLAADSLKGRYNFGRILGLALAIGGALAETLASQIPGIPSGLRAGFAYAGAALLVCVPLVSRFLSNRETLDAWLRARGASQRLKAEVYQHIMGAGPYKDAATRDAVLVDRRDEALAVVGDLERHIANVKPDKPLPKCATVDEYIAQRLDSAITNFFGPKAAREERQATIFRWTEAGLSVLAAVLGVLAGATGSGRVGPWIAVITTIAAAVAAHVAAARHDYNVSNYLATVRRLTSLRDKWRASHPTPTPADIETLVADTEAAISEQREGWMHEWMKAK